MTTSTTMLSISGLFKARPAEEGGERLLYMEASNESVDLQGERVLAKCLEQSAPHFLRYGNLDIDHRTQQSPRGGSEDPYLWEIGQPREVHVDGARTFVKAVLYQGTGRQAERAGMVWDSMTKLQPAVRWYPSVAGQYPTREVQVDPITKAAVIAVTSVIWTNIGLSRTPVNNAVPPASILPVAVFAKCLTPDGCFDVGKALVAGYGTDASTLTDGAALGVASLDLKIQTQTLDEHAYLAARSAMARQVRARGLDTDDLSSLLVDQFSVPPDEAARWVERFLRDMRAP